MIKIGLNSYFTVLSGNRLQAFGNRVLQVSDEKLYSNESGMAVFLCEIQAEDGEQLQQEATDG